MTQQRSNTPFQTMCHGKPSVSVITICGVGQTTRCKPSRVPLPTIFEEDPESCLPNLSQLPKQMQELLADPLELLNESGNAKIVAASLNNARKCDRTVLLAWLANSLTAMAFSKEAHSVALAAISVAAGPDRNIFAEIFKGYVLELSMSQFGHEVLMKLIETLPSSLLRFVTDELTGQTVRIAQRKHGCHVIESMFTYCPSSMTSEIATEIAGEADHLVRNWQGKDVVQKLLEYGTPDCRSMIIRKLMPQLVRLSVHRIASHVVKQALEFADELEQQMMAQSLLKGSKMISTSDIACSRGGSSILQEINNLGHCRTQFQLRLADAAPRLGKCRFGRRTIACFGLQSSPALQGQQL